MIPFLRIVALALVSSVVALAAPVIFAVSPANGPETGGITISVDGSGFGITPSPIVTLAGNPIIPISSSDTQIQFTLPAGSGTVILAVTSAGQSAQAIFTYDPPPPPAPVILTITPDRGLASENSSIVITGQNFSVNSIVTVGSQLATVTSSSPTLITANKPVDAGGNLAVVVTANGQSSNAKIYRSVALTSLPGYYVDLVTEQVLPAPLGTYADLANLTQAKPAPPGFYAPVVGMHAAIPCPPGTFSSSAGAAAPTPAPPGTFAASAGMTLPTAAPIGKYAPVSQMTDAIPASPGYFVDVAGASEQTPAPLGKFVPVAGASTAVNAGLGFYAPVTGMSAAIPSAPGYYVNLPGAAAPTPAAAGTYAPAAAMSSPVPAAAGTYAPIAGMAASIPASPGYFVNVAGSATQQPAPLGQFVAAAGQALPSTVPAGYYGPVIGLQAAIPAPQGTYSPVAGSAQPLPVPPGFIATGPAASSISPLPQIKLTAYTLGPATAQSLSFETANSQNYGIFYSENLEDFVLLETVPGTGGVVTRSFDPLVSTTSKRFYIVAPVP